MKKKNALFYTIIIILLLIGVGLAILINYLNGVDLVAMMTSKYALTIEIAIGVVLVVFIALLLREWSRK